MQNAFPGLKVDKSEIEIRDKNSYIFLWEDNKTTWEVFKIGRMYLTDTYAIEANILLALIKEKDGSVVDVLSKMPYLLQAYSDVLNPPKG